LKAEVFRIELHLKRGEQLLGILNSYEIDFLWLNCKFQPTDAFREVAPLFEEELKFLNADDMEARETAYSQVESLGLRLVDITGGKNIDEFLLHIQGDEAWCRY